MPLKKESSAVNADADALVMALRNPTIRVEAIACDRFDGARRPMILETIRRDAGEITLVTPPATSPREVKSIFVYFLYVKNGICHFDQLT